MRAIAGALLLLAPLWVAAPAMAQAPAAQPKPAAAAAPAKPAPAARPASGSPRAVYDAMAENERINLQYQLIWTGDYNGIANGDFKDSSIAAVKAYQKRNGGKETGILNPDERGKLAQSAKRQQDRVGWRMLDDRATAAHLGIPGKLAPQSAASGSGTRWQSSRGEVQVETFRVAGPGTTLATVFEQQKKEPAQRKVDYNVLRGDFFVVSGLQGLKKFYVRAHVKDNEVRGVTILYDQAMEGIMDPVVIAMSSAYSPFPLLSVAIGPPPRKKVEYGSGIVVSAEGDIVTDRLLTDECQVVIVAGHGHADKVAEDKAVDLALLRVYGARGLTALPLAPETARPEAILVGVADPQAQAGGGAVSTAPARFAAASGGMSLTPPPAPGFSGGAVVDAGAGVVGMVTTRAQVVAGPPTAPAPASLVPSETMVKFLAAQGVTPQSGRVSADAARSGVVRVICVRN